MKSTLQAIEHVLHAVCHTGNSFTNSSKPFCFHCCLTKFHIVNRHGDLAGNRFTKEQIILIEAFPAFLIDSFKCANTFILNN